MFLTKLISSRIILLAVFIDLVVCLYIIFYLFGLSLYFTFCLLSHYPYYS